MLDLDDPSTQVLIMAPTRELALQIFNVLRHLSHFMNVTMHCCVGGTALQEDMKKLDAASLEHLAAIVKEMVGNK